ncbi:MAG: hypothetical protein JXK93_09450 [Sphaerochaetaceae bacterium]|nr:hypothetical protein [Sphaerochaetaceae bacterium]
MKRMIGRFLMFAILSLVLLFPLGASPDAGISLSTFSHIAGDTVLEQGTYVKLGGLLTLTKTIEVEISSTVRVLPDLGSQMMIRTGVNYALLATAFRMGGEVPQYPNMFLGLGGFINTPAFDSWGPILSLTPLTTGGPEFRRKERFATLSIAYDIPGERFSLFFELFGIDFYL